MWNADVTFCCLMAGPLTPTVELCIFDTKSLIS